MNRLLSFRKVSDIRLGNEPAFDAWFYSFCAENNIEHSINPTGVAGPEQLRFMVALDERQIYAPCSDRTFIQLLEASQTRSFSPRLRRQYAEAWRSIISVLHRQVEDREKRRTIINYCRLRFRGCLALGNILPSRLIKRLVTTLLSQFEGRDPWREARQSQYHELVRFLESETFCRQLEAIPQQALSHTDMGSLRRELDVIELARLFHLAGRRAESLAALVRQAEQSATTELFRGAEALVPQIETLLGAPGASRTFLYICDMEGGLALDLQIIRTLLRLGHKVILTLKETPLYMAPTIWDVAFNPVIMNRFAESFILRDPATSKNALLRKLRESRLLIISDGTGERLNLYRASVTFARAWKECDAVLARGLCNRDVLFWTSHLFTRDIFCFWEGREGVRMECRPRSPEVRKFSEQKLNAKAASIIQSMRAARDEGKSVMFYSCIIGSIPGQTHVAIRVAETFVTFLRERLDQIFIINPAEYFEPGMDGDDLMYMWEQVQRSGLITIWRFQSMEDIETSFSLLGRKVPPVWSGKDATFSTGCTKEMHIALDMQKSHPELQIVGPGPEKFFRRGDYGVGKYFDATLSNANQDFI